MLLSGYTKRSESTPIALSRCVGMSLGCHLVVGSSYLWLYQLCSHLIICDIWCFNQTSGLSMVTYDNDAGGAVGVTEKLMVGR